MSALNILFQQIPANFFEADDTEQKWMKIFEENKTLPVIYQLVSAILSMPVSNSFIERIFSLCGVQWTKERNKLEVQTVKSLVQTKVNFDFNCIEMYNFLLKNNVLLKKIRAWEKYF